MRSYTTLKGLIMFILAIVFTFVLSCALTILWHKVRQARNEVTNLWLICSGVRISYDREMSIYHDDNLTIEEKYKKIYNR